MKRFLLALALVAVAGTTYVATAPGSQTAGPTATQFNSLEKRVARLQKDEGKVRQIAIGEAFLLTDCMKYSYPVDTFGDAQNNPATYGYTYTDPNVNGGTPFLTTAMDFSSFADPNALWITGGDATCGTDINAALRKVSRLSGIRLHRATPHVFSAHRP